VGGKAFKRKKKKKVDCPNSLYLLNNPNMYKFDKTIKMYFP